MLRVPHPHLLPPPPPPPTPPHPLPPIRAEFNLDIHGKYGKKLVRTGSRLMGPPEENLTFCSDPAVLSSPPHFCTAH
jgi:hypothetical protein